MLPPTRSLIVREGDKPVISQPLIPRQAFRKAPAPKPAPSKYVGPAVEIDDDFDVDLPSANSFFTFEAAKEAPDATLSAEEVRRKAREAILASEATAKTFSEASTSQGPSSSSVLASSSMSHNNLPPLKEKPFTEWELQNRSCVHQHGDNDDEFQHEDEEEPMFTAETFIPGPEVSRTVFSRICLFPVWDFI